MKAKPTSDAVKLATEAAAAKEAELNAAREDVKRLEAECREANAAIYRAQVEADAHLPSCRLVSIAWRSGREDDIGRVVILRKTPGGQLVVRRVGQASGTESKFKLNPHRLVYEAAEKSKSWISGTKELRDVPAEYMPVSARAALDAGRMDGEKAPGQSSTG
jgi:hypothetical protein